MNKIMIKTSILFFMLSTLSVMNISYAKTIDTGKRVHSDNHFDYFYKTRDKKDAQYGNVKWYLQNKTNKAIYVDVLRVRYTCRNKLRGHSFSKTVEPGDFVTMNGWDGVCGGKKEQPVPKVAYVSMKGKGDPYNKIVCKDKSRHYYTVDASKRNVIRLITPKLKVTYNVKKFMELTSDAQKFEKEELNKATCGDGSSGSIVKSLRKGVLEYFKNKVKEYRKLCKKNPESDACGKVEEWKAAAIGVRG